MRRQPGAEAAWPAGGGSTACAFGVRNATLTYPPKAEPGAVPAAQAASQPQAKKVQIFLGSFSDQRSDKRVIGTMRNGFGMRTADVVAVNSVPDWVTQAVKLELEQSGYSVMPVAGGEQPVKGSAIVSGEISNVFCDMYFSYTGQVTLLTRVSMDGRDLMTKHFASEGSAGLAFAGTAESFAQSLSLALAGAIRQFIAELDSRLSAP